MSKADLQEPVIARAHLKRHSLHSAASLWAYLIKGRTFQVSSLFLLMILAAITEMATLASVLPLVSTLVNIESGTLSDTGVALPASISSLGATLSTNSLLILIVAIVCLSAVLRILVIRKSARFSATVAIDLQTVYFRKLLDSDYETIINQSSSENISFATNKMQLIIRTYILSVLLTLTAVVSASGVIVVLAWMSNIIIIFALLALTAAYVLIARYSRSGLQHYGQQLKQAYVKQVQHLREGLGGIRDVAMSGNQEMHTRRFNETTTRVERANAELIFYNSFPRPLLQAIAICSVVAIAAAVENGLVSGQNILPLLGVFALGMLRLLPYMQQIFSQWSRFVSGMSILDELLDAMDDFKTPAGAHGPKAEGELPLLSNNISLSDVSFCYQQTAGPALHDINIHVRKGEFIGVVGETGSGKSTLVDLLMGLLLPTKGEIQIDGVVIDDSNRSSWRRQVAHVPQRVFLNQASIAENIAFSVSATDVDMEKVARCAKLAQINDYALSLPLGYQTQVGEDGERLSGGQRQRIGIARALYSDKPVLILDEATNALDAATELSIINGLLACDKKYTIIAVAHGVQAIAYCHRKLLLGDGKALWINSEEINE